MAEESKNIRSGDLISILPVRDMVLFPKAVAPITVGRKRSLRLINNLKKEDRYIGLIAQKDPRMDRPQPGDLHSVGTVATLHKVVSMPNETMLVLMEGVKRFRITEFVQEEPFLKGRVEILEDILPAEQGLELQALVRTVQDLYQEIVTNAPNLSDELQAMVSDVSNPSQLGDFVAASLSFLTTDVKQELLETIDVRARLRRLMEELFKEREILRVRNKIQTDVQEQVSQNQREYLLREQMRAIQKELGEEDDGRREAEELRQKLAEAGLPEEAQKEADRELGRLQRMSPAASEYSVTRTYLEWLASLPWTKSSAEEVDVNHAEECLNEDHYDLEKPKQRILEYLSVLQLKKDMKGPILCFTGPPGVGKTSLGKSIARALGRKFVRISLGGMHDEAEIRGHRRTYIGAMPGQIIQGLRRAETNDPVFMLDEVDKIGRDFRGDPAAALLEVLDPEQNHTFRDHYLDVPFDLSKVLFIATTNVLDTIPPALRDRMEVLELAGYTEEEKVQIAKKYIVPKQTSGHGFEGDRKIEFTDEALQEIIRSYTHEAGVRNMERQVATICRKRARQIAQKEEGADELFSVTPATVREMLGVPRFRIETEIEERTEMPGVAVALAWTPAGGDILFVEAARMPGCGEGGRGEFIVTGQVGEVMRESMRAALTWVRGNAERYGLDPVAVQKADVHLHVPAGAIPKDGPSAGIVMATALMSLFSGQKVKPRVALSGEITLSGQVLPVGGIKEKVLAAKRSGVRTLVMPKENEPNVQEDIPEPLREGLTFHFVKTVDEALRHAFEVKFTEEPKTASAGHRTIKPSGEAVPPGPLPH